MDQFYEDLLQAGLMRRQVLVQDAGIRKAAHQRSDSGPLGMAVKLVTKHMAVVIQAQIPLRQLSWDLVERLGKSNVERLAAHLGHEIALRIDWNRRARALDQVATIDGVQEARWR